MGNILEKNYIIYKLLDINNLSFKFFKKHSL
jgi:hypothetical protein